MIPFDPLALIGHFIHATVQPCDSAEILETLADLLTELPIISGLAIYIADADHFALRDSIGFAADNREALLAWDGLVGDGMAITDVLTEYLQSAEINAITHCTPLVGDTTTFGVLCIFATDHSTFDEAQIQFFDTLGKVVGVSLHNAALYEAEQVSRQQIKQVAQRLLVSQEMERERIANELHRNAVQELVGIKIHLDMLEADTEEPSADLTTAKGLCEGVLSRLNLLALALRPVVLQDLGLNPALHSFCREITARSETTIHYNGTTNLPPIDNAHAIALYRFLQESLSTIQSSSISVQLKAHSDAISLSIWHKDGTVGAEVKRISLAGMRERLEAVGGTLTATQQDEGGYILTALIRL